jgi:hypothetical protein
MIMVRVPAVRQLGQVGFATCSILFLPESCVHIAYELDGIIEPGGSMDI